MRAFINSEGVYHEGEEQPGDVEVPIRPSEAHVWNGTEWAISPELRDAAEQTGDAAKSARTTEAANDPDGGIV